MKKNLNETIEAEWIENPGYAPEDQSFPKGTPIERAANQIVIDMDNEVPGCADQISSVARTPEDLEYPFDLEISDDCADALDMAISSLDVDGEGNYLLGDVLQALFDAINARAGSHFIEESSRNRRSFKPSKKQLKRIIREEKARMLEMRYNNADTLDPRIVSNLLGKINAAVDQLLNMGMDPDSLQDELESIALSLRGDADFQYYDDLAHTPAELEKGMYNENYKKTT